MFRVEGLSVEIAGVQVLRDVDFKLQTGDYTVLVGRNGAGKSTTLRSIMGLLPRQQGSIVLNGEDIASSPSYQRAADGIGYAPEDRRLIGGFTVEENILLPALALKLPSAEKARRLEEVYSLLPQLSKMRTQPGGGVSGGQGKMVALGRALMVATKVLFLDEPLQGLAPALALDYARTLASLKESRPDIALLITESSPKLLQDVADRTFVIERGTIS